jgi:hypothetical protein
MSCTNSKLKGEKHKNTKMKEEEKNKKGTTQLGRPEATTAESA